MKFGLIPEFIGRVPVTVALDLLDEEALKEILTRPKNAITKQYQKLLSLDGVKLNLRMMRLRKLPAFPMKEKRVPEDCVRFLNRV